MREYVEEPGGGGEELFTYYQGTTGPYVDKRLPRTSAIHIRNLRNHVNSVMYEKKRAIRDQEAEDLLPTLEKYLELDSKTFFLYIPDEDLCKRNNYNWFIYLNKKEIIESRTNIGKYLMISYN